jgi:LmbE family N-acetylglucosaminyl deacetylase
MKLDLSTLGTTLVVAPHPDDESLGCGGLIARLRDVDQEVHILLVSDGTGSHPNSLTFPPDRLRETRYQELREAASILGVAPDAISFLHCPDRYVPGPESPDFYRVAGQVNRVLLDVRPDTIVVPWRRDRHGDHEASWQIVHTAAQQSGFSGRWLEYQVWMSELGDAEAWPRPGEMRSLELDITSVIERKRQAISQYRSQISDLISDDPAGFQLSPETLARFDEPVERFLEPNDG